MRLRNQRNCAGVLSAALLRLRARPAKRPRSSSWRLGVLASCPTPNQGNGLAQRLEAPAQGAPNPTPMQPHCRAVRQDAKTPRHQDSGRPPKAPQAPQRTRKRNSTNSTSPTYPHHPKRPHAANTQHSGKEQKGASPQCVIARRSAYNPTERRYPPAGAESDGSRRVFHAVPHDWHHLNKSRKRKCGQQKPETSLYLASIVRGVPREKARREPVVSAPPTPRRCPPAAP